LHRARRVADIGRGVCAAARSDGIALIFTSLLAIAGYMVQSKNAADADRAQHEVVQEAADREQTRGLAAIQLERVQSQMGDVYRPVQFILNQADACAIYMQHELGFEFNDVWALEFVRPFALWPHLEVYTRDFGPMCLAAMKGSPYKKYSPADIALLEDPAKRQVYIEAHTSCIAPRWREVAAILSTKSALMENPPPSFLDGVFPADGVNWTKVSGGTLTSHMQDMAAFAHVWAPLERRWEAEGATVVMHSTTLHVCHMCCWQRMPGLGFIRVANLSPQLADFSRMQPEQPNPWIIVFFIFTKMISAAGVKEAELQGASSVVRGNATIEAMQGET
jgi:hypothetical protein